MDERERGCVSEMKETEHQGNPHQLSQVLLCSFESFDSVHSWSPINDGVMGGFSRSDVQQTDTPALRFSGIVSLENGGGFASVRSGPVSFDLSGYDGILMRFRGDGHRYALNLRTEYHIRGGSYRRQFDTEPIAWGEHYFPFSGFAPTSFGRPVHDAPALDSANIRSFGLLISSRQHGPFSLEVAWLQAVRHR